MCEQLLGKDFKPGRVHYETGKLYMKLLQWFGLYFAETIFRLVHKQES